MPELTAENRNYVLYAHPRSKKIEYADYVQESGDLLTQASDTLVTEDGDTFVLEGVVALSLSYALVAEKKNYALSALRRFPLAAAFEAVEGNISLEPVFVASDFVGYYPFDADADDDSGNGNDPSTESGGIIYPSHITPQVGSGAVQLAEATTNLVTNPSFETNTTGWAASGSNTIAQSSDQAKVGSNSLKCTYQNHNVLCFFSITLTAVVHSFGVWIWIPSDYDGETVRCAFAGFSGQSGTITADADLSKTDQWQFVSVDSTPDAGDLSGEVRVVSPDAAPTAGKFLYIDAVQVEAKAYPTPYCDGSLGTGHSWSGTAHASTSSRTATDLDYTLTAGAAFSIGGWWIPSTLETEHASDAYIFDWYNNANDRIALRYDAAANDLDADLIVDGSSNTVTYSTALARHTAFHFILTWDGATFTLYINGSSVGTPASESGTWGTAPSTLYLGMDNGAANHANGWLDDSFDLDYALTANEADALYRWGIGDSTLLLEDGSNLVYTDIRGN